MYRFFWEIERISEFRHPPKKSIFKKVSLSTWQKFPEGGKTSREKKSDLVCWKVHFEFFLSVFHIWIFSFYHILNIASCVSTKWKKWKDLHKQALKYVVGFLALYISLEMQNSKQRFAIIVYFCAHNTKIFLGIWSWFIWSTKICNVYILALQFLL